MTFSRWLRLGMVVGGAVVGAAAVMAYKRDRAHVLARIAAGSVIAETARGPIEYATLGSGPAVLVAHGGGGGYDQAQSLFWPNRGFTFIMPSRPGYLRTPLSSGASAEEQADAFAALLDSLGIARAAIVGISAGGPVAVAFAARHAERCWGLVLISAISQPMPVMPPLIERVMPFLQMDGIVWAATRFMRESLLVPFGITAADWENAEQGQRLAHFVETMRPMDWRMAGILNDLRHNDIDPRAIERVSAPVQVIHGDADEIVPWAHAENVVQHAPQAELYRVVGGGHLSIITHVAEVEPVVLQFLHRNAPKARG